MSTMDSLTSIVQSPLLTTLAGPLVFLTSLLFFWWRVGSLHSMLDRLWRIVAGKTEVQDPVLRKLTQEYRDLEYFRFVYGIRAERANDIGRLKYWLDRHDIGIVRLQKAGEWVNVRSKGIITEPTDRQRRWRMALVALWYLLFALATFAINDNDAFLQFRESKKWFRTDGNTLSSVLGATTVKLELCGNDQGAIARQMQFSTPEASAICTGYGDKSLQKVIGDGVRAQRWLAGITGAAALWMTIMCVLKLKAVEAARRLCRELRAAAQQGDSADDSSSDVDRVETLREHVPAAAE